MSSSGLIYAVIVGAWAAYLVPMWLRRQDELNEARPTERFSTAIRLLSGRAGMERRYAKDLQARPSDEDEQPGPPADPDAITDAVDVRAFVAPAEGGRRGASARVPGGERGPGHERAQGAERAQGHERERDRAHGAERQAAGADRAQGAGRRPGGPQQGPARRRVTAEGEPAQVPAQAGETEPEAVAESTAAAAAAARNGAAAQARARRTRVLARRRRTTVLLFAAFTLGAVVAGVGGVTFLWAPALPALLLSAYIVYLRAQERRRFAYVMDRRQAELAAQHLRERQPRRRQPAAARAAAEDPEDGPADDAAATDPGLEALAADRRALVEQTDHAEWVDQQRERQRRPGAGDSWDPVPVPLPTYVTAPVAPRAGGGIDYGAPETWSAARSSAAEQAEPGAQTPAPADGQTADSRPADAQTADDGRSDARRAASARRSRERGRTPLFDQYDNGTGADGRPRAANE